MLKKLSSNAYTLELPLDIGISPTFNVVDLTLYCGHDSEEDFEEQIITLLAALLSKDTATDFQRLNPDLYERYQAINSPESSSSKPERVGALWKPKKVLGPT